MDVLALTWLRFDQPALLALGVLAAGPVLAAAWGRGRGRHVAAGSVVLEALAVLLAAVALAQPQVALVSSAQRPLVVLSDVSDSVRIQRDRPLELPVSVRAQRYAFAAAVADEASPRPPGGSTLAAPALRLAAARAAGAAGVLIHTDGQFTDDDWQAAAAALRASGVEVAILPMQSPPLDVAVTRLSAARAAGGEVELAVSIRSNGADTRVLTVSRSGEPQPLLRRELSLLGDDATTIHLTDALPQGQPGRYRAELSAGDGFPENDAAETAVGPLTQRTAVIIAGGVAPALADALRPQVLNPVDAPANADEWAAYSCVVLVDASGTALSGPQRESLAQYVRGGGGLLLIGAGPHASPADRDDPLNRVLPLVVNPYDRRPLAVAVVLDSSGSMAESVATDRGDQLKFDLARAAVVALRQHLTPKDTLAVITFADEPTTVYDSGPLPPDFPALRDALLKVRPAGSTKVAPALERALALPAVEGRDRLVLVLSDLQTEDFAPAGLAGEFRRAGASLAVVAVGSAAGDAPPLARLAKDLDAPLVRRESLLGVAEIFGGLIRQHRGPVARVPTSPPRLQSGVALPALPDVAQYLPAAARGDADLLAMIDDQPLVAAVTAGLGRSAMAALPLEANASWRTWGGWNALARAVARAQGDSRFFGEVSYGPAGRPHLRVTAREQVGINGLELTARMWWGQDVPAQIALPQTGVGIYEADLPQQAATAAIEVLQGSRRVWQGAAGGRPPRELATIGPSRENLQRLAALTGGRIIDRAELASLARQWDQRRFHAAWWLLALAALALMLCDWAATRILRK